MKMSQCCVHGCPSRKSTGSLVSFHAFPKEKSTFLYVTDNKNGVQKRMDRKKIWEMILLMQEPAAPHHRVCSLHFQQDDYQTPGYLIKPTKLRNYVIPTLNLPQVPAVMKRGHVRRCSVRGCDTSSSTSAKKLFKVPVFESYSYSLNWRKWDMWLDALGFSKEEPKRLRVCEDHFVKGAPSDDRNDPDYVPSLKLESEKLQIEEVNIKADDAKMTYETGEDPLRLDEDAEYVSAIKEEPMEFEENVLENIKLEPLELDEIVQIKIESDCFIADHSYCKV